MHDCCSLSSLSGVFSSRCFFFHFAEETTGQRRRRQTSTWKMKQKSETLGGVRGKKANNDSISRNLSSSLVCSLSLPRQVVRCQNSAREMEMKLSLFKKEQQRVNSNEWKKKSSQKALSSLTATTRFEKKLKNGRSQFWFCKILSWLRCGQQ